MPRQAVLLLWLALIGVCVGCSGALAHEVRPAYLEITQPNSTTYEILWKQPVMGEIAVHLVPHLSNGWLEGPPLQQYTAGGFLIRTWRIAPASTAALDGTSIEIEGLAYTITDVFARVRLAGGTSLDAVIHPGQPRVAVSIHTARHFALPAYLLLGIEHILTGPDHLLFVLGLVLLVSGRSMLLKTVTAFTLAHSITLALAVLGEVRLPTAFVETLISLSIALLAPEILRSWRGEVSLAVRYPWAVAFVFGLFHGMGFASGLTSLGFESQDLFSALVLFNVGVEAGQLAFIVVVLAIGAALSPTRLVRLTVAQRLPPYVVGVAGAYWTIQCGATWLG
jgi:hydrogenase/urease accessory protein HupE